MRSMQRSKHANQCSAESRTHDYQFVLALSFSHSLFFIVPLSSSFFPNMSLHHNKMSKKMPFPSYQNISRSTDDTGWFTTFSYLYINCMLTWFSLWSCCTLNFAVFKLPVATIAINSHWMSLLWLWSLAI